MTSSYLFSEHMLSYRFPRTCLASFYTDLRDQGMAKKSWQERGDLILEDFLLSKSFLECFGTYDLKVAFASYFFSIPEPGNTLFMRFWNSIDKERVRVSNLSQEIFLIKKLLRGESFSFQSQAQTCLYYFLGAYFCTFLLEDLTLDLNVQTYVCTVTNYTLSPSFLEWKKRISFNKVEVSTF